MTTTAALLQRLEEELLQPATRSNPEAVAALLHDDFREFGSSGRTYTKPEILAELATEPPRIITLTDFACSFPSPEVALVTYRSTRITPGSPNFHALRSSLWTLREGHWQMLFHQGTSIRP
jgi:hypothetical protein